VRLPEVALDVMGLFPSRSCFLVGGAVRDLLSDTEPCDYDFVTSVSPLGVHEYLSHLKPRDMGYGVVEFTLHGYDCQVAVMRSESYGADPHRPEHVEFTDDLMLDLSRRDFTINAMALDSVGTLIDPFGGASDLLSCDLRTPGVAFESFHDDVLRVLRAARFVSLGFEPSVAIKDAASDSRIHGRFSHLSVERVSRELDRIILSSEPSRGLYFLLQCGVLNLSCCCKEHGNVRLVSFLPELSSLSGVSQNSRYHKYDALEHTLRTIDAVPSELELRYAALFHDIAKGMPGIRGINKRGELCDHGHEIKGAEVCEDVMSRLSYSKSLVSSVTWLVRHHMDIPPADLSQVSRWLRRKSKHFSDRESFELSIDRLFALAEADNKGRGIGDTDLSANRVAVDTILECLPLYVKELSVDGNDVTSRGFSGPRVGHVLDDLLVRVQSGQLENKESSLRQAVDKKVLRLALKGEM